MFRRHKESSAFLTSVSDHNDISFWFHQNFNRKETRPKQRKGAARCVDLNLDPQNSHKTWAAWHILVFQMLEKQNQEGPGGLLVSQPS